MPRPHRPARWVMAAVSFATASPSALGAQSRPAATDRPIPYPVTPPAAFQRAIERGTRTDVGRPGPAYWQQWADYQLYARLHPEEKRLEGSARIRYYNHSPDTLGLLFLHLHQNLHAPGAVRNREAEVTGGVEIQRVVADGRRLVEQMDYGIQGTVLGLRPPNPLAPRDSVEIEVDWGFVVPQSGAGRMGWSRDNLFFIAYWYPQMAVYDDVVGWQIDPYLGNSEFYAGFGRYDLTVEAPPGWLVVATGTLRNPEAVLPEPVRQRLARAEDSDDVVHVVTEEDLAAGTATLSGSQETLTWRFQADSVRDVAFSATSASLWDAARTPVGDRDGDGTEDYARVGAVYRATAPKWGESWRYSQHAIAFLSRFSALPYPWPHMTAVEGADIIGGGMEFPMMTLIGDYNRSSDSALYYVHAHELGHMWVPMIVSVDERRYAWMDEGTTTFNENQARKEFFPGIDHEEGDRNSYLSVALAGVEGEMMRRTDYHYSGAARGVASYSKPAVLLAALRGLLGEETFLRAYRDYLDTWAYRHPKPWDFFNAIASGAGRDLDWFWRSWYYETWLLDQAVENVSPTERGTRIVIADRGDVPMPVLLQITREDGELLHREVGVQTWLGGSRSAEVVIPPGAPVMRVEIDPTGAFPDANRDNNVWNRGDDRRGAPGASP